MSGYPPIIGRNPSGQDFVLADNVVPVRTESDFGTIVPATRIDVIPNTAFVLQTPVTQTLPFVIPNDSSMQILTTNRSINTLTYTNATEEQFQGTDITLSIFDVVFNGNSTATAFNINGGILSLKFPDFNRYSGMGTIQNLIDLFSPGVFYDVIDSGLIMINCATHTFQGCLILALDGNTLTFFNISGASAGDVQIVDNLFDNDAFGSFVHIDGATYPAGKTATIARNPISNPSNFFDGTSIDETDLRMFIAGNKGQKNSEIIGEWTVLGNAVVTTIALADTFQDVDVTGAAAGLLIERFTLTDTTIGELTYIGLDPFNGILLVSISGFKSGSTARYTFTIAVNDTVPAGAPESSFEIKTDLGNKVLLGSVTLVTGDTVKLQVKGVSTSDNLTIEEVSFDIRM